MYRSRNSIIAILGLLTLIGVTVAVVPHTGSGQALQGNGAVQLNCDERPCDAVARGRAAFNDRNLKELGGNGRSCRRLSHAVGGLSALSRGRSGPVSMRCRRNESTTRMRTIRSSGPWTLTTSG